MNKNEDDKEVKNKKVVQTEKINIIKLPYQYILTKDA